MDTPRTTSANRAHRFLYRGNKKKKPKPKKILLFCFFFFLFLGPRGSSWVWCIFCTFFLLCLRFGADVLVKLTLCVITTVSCHTQEKVAVNAPQIRSAALSMCCNHRNVCISKNEIFLGSCHSLNSTHQLTFPPSSRNILWENGLLSLQVSGAHLQEKKKLSGWGTFLWKKSSSEKHFYKIPF